jgi:hypothetical protein
MTREDMTRWAREAGFLVDEADFITAPKNGRIGFQLELERFAALVAEAAKPEPATDAEMLKAYTESAADGWQFCDGWRDAERFHGIGKGGKT